jgi:hypothetical protein
MAVKFSDFSIGAIGADLEIVGYDSGTVSNVQVSYSDLKIDILGDAVTGTGASGQVAYWNGTETQAGSNNLFWDAVNSRLGIRSSSPTGNLEIKTANDLATLRAYPNDDSSSPLHLLRGNNGVVALNTFTSNGTITSPTDVSASGGILRLTGNIYIDGAYRTVARMEYITTSVPAIGNPPTAIRWLTTNASYSLDEKMRLTAAGRLLLGTTTESTNILEVVGTARISSDLTVNGVFLQTVTTNRQTASYTLALADRGKLVEMNVATANNLTIPLDSAVAFPVGTQIDISQYGAGQTTVVATGGVTVRSAAGALKLAAQYSGATLVKIATNEWYLFGDITV